MVKVVEEVVELKVEDLELNEDRRSLRWSWTNNERIVNCYFCNNGSNCVFCPIYDQNIS